MTNQLTLEIQLSNDDKELMLSINEKVDRLFKRLDELENKTKSTGWTTITPYLKNGLLPVSLKDFRKLRSQGKAPQQYGYKMKKADMDEFLAQFPNYTAPEFRDKTPANA